MKQCYVLSNPKTFFFRFNNSVFGSKWSGLWFPSTKVMDYFAFNVDGEWLGEHNFKGFSMQNGTAEHVYKTNDLILKERLTIPVNIPGLINILYVENLGENRKFNITMKPGINMRDIGENVHTRVYKVVETNPLYITSDIADLAIRSDGDFDFSVDEKYLAHTPGAYISEWGWNDESEQSVYEPGMIHTEIEVKKNRSESIPFLISNRQNLREMMNYKELIKHRNDLEIKRSQFYSDPSLSSISRTMSSFYSHSNIGSGFFAGFPWFQSYWGRDSGHIIFALSNLGMWDEVKQSLLTLARYEKNGIIPNTLYLSGVPTYNSSDSSPFFIIALHHYVSYSKDYKTLKQLMPKVNSILERGETFIRNGMIHSNPGETWMDTLNRQGYCIDIQSLWAEAFLRAADLGDKKHISIANSLIKSINTAFWKDGYFLDILNSTSRRPNVLFPLFFGHIENDKAEAALSVLESDEFTSSVGIRSLSSRDANYNPRDYHNGNVWGLLTGMMCHSEFVYNRVKQGSKYLNLIKKNLGIRCFDSVDEVYDGDTGFPLGCVSQAWSISPVIKTVDEMIFGINPDTDNNIVFQPKISPEMNLERKGLRIGSDVIDISFSDGVFRINGLKENHLKARTNYKVEVV